VGGVRVHHVLRTSYVVSRVVDVQNPVGIEAIVWEKHRIGITVLWMNHLTTLAVNQGQDTGKEVVLQLGQKIL
jgi:hypothetical protein